MYSERVFFRCVNFLHWIYTLQRVNCYLTAYFSIAYTVLFLGLFFRFEYKGTLRSPTTWVLQKVPFLFSLILNQSISVLFIIINGRNNIAKSSIICTFRKHFENIVPFFWNYYCIFASIFTCFIIMYGKERCKQIEDNVGSNQALKQVVGRNVR